MQKHLLASKTFLFNSACIAGYVLMKATEAHYTLPISVDEAGSVLIPAVNIVLRLITKTKVFL